MSASVINSTPCVSDLGISSRPNTTMSVNIATGLKASYKNKQDYTVEEALIKLQNTSSNYEVLKIINKVFFDVDGKGFDPAEYNRLYTETLREIHLIISHNFGDDYAILDSSSAEYNKVSFRVVIAKTTADLATNKELVGKLNNDFTLPVPCKFDHCCYGRNQKIRMLGSSKDGEDRPFKLIHGNPIDTLITYIPEDSHPIQYEPSVSDETSSDPREVIEVDQSKLCQYLDCIKTEHWADYEICLKLIWAMCFCDADKDIIHKYCRKASNYGSKWVDDAIRNFNPARSATLNYIKKLARQDNETQYNAIATDTQDLIEELTQLTTDEHTIFDNERWLSPLPPFTTLCVKAMLGTGKTRRVLSFIKGLKPNTRILVLSGRRTWSDHIYEELSTLDFVHYEKHKEEFGLKKHICAPRLILQLSPNSFSLIEGEVYDVVIIDESETVLSMLSPLTIYKDTAKYLTMIETFEKVVTSANQVLCLDAFLCDRTVDLVTALRGKTTLIINTTLPYDKQATLFESETDFYSKLRNAVVKEDKRVISMWATPKSGAHFHEVLDKEGIPNQFYHGKSDSKIKARDMADVNKFWAGYQSVGYTGTITVGINYTNKNALFDTMSLYASSWGCSARDCAQGLHRAREIKDNTLLLHISQAVKPCLVEPGMQNQAKLWSLESEVRKKVLSDIGENPAEFSSIKQWLKQLIMFNRNEIAMNRKHFHDLQLHYLKLCGINVIQDLKAVEVEVKKKSKGIIPDVETIRIIPPEEADFLNAHRRSISTEDQYALEKYYLNLRVVKIDQFIWEQWLKNKHVIENAYRFIHNTPADLVNSTVIDLLSKDVGRLHTIKSCGLDFNSSFSISIEDMPHINIDTFGVRIRSVKDTHEQHCRNVCKAFQSWGLDIEVQRKRTRVGKTHHYCYTVNFDREKSVISYIVP